MKSEVARTEAQVISAPDWPRRPLGDLCRIELGSTPARGNVQNWDDARSSHNVWLSIADMPSSLHAVASDSREYVSDSAAQRMRLVPEETLLVSFKLTLGRLCYAGRDLFTNEAIAALHDIDSSHICKEFLYWYLTYFDWNAAAAGDHKIKGKTLNKTKLKALPVIVPPLAEQKRIVAVLDQAFAALDRARTYAEANLADARSLRERAIGAVFAYAEAEGWDSEVLKILTHINYGYTEKANHEQVGPKFLRITDIQAGEVKWENVPYCEAGVDEIRKYGLNSGDIVFARTGATTGKSFLILDPPTAVAASYLIRLRIKNESLSPKFLSYYFQSDKYWDTVRKGTSGSAQGGFNASKLGKMTVPLPSKGRQGELVRKLDRIQESARALESRFEQKLTDIADLRQSILQKAFAGELT